MITLITDPETDDYDTYRIVLYYCYVPLDDNDIETLYNFHLSYYNHESTLGGRIRIASEGLNGVLSGTNIDLQQYEHQLRTLLYTITSSKDENIGSLHDNHATVIDDTSNVSVRWELDVKYCKLRTDLTVQSQLFPKWQIQKTDTVIGLIEQRTTTGNIDIDETSSSIPTHPKRNRRRQQQQQQQPQNELEEQQQVRQQQQLDMIRNIYDKSIMNKVCKKQFVSSAPHLSPMEWNSKLEQLVQQQQHQSNVLTSNESSKTNIVLLDCRNCYESAVGYFEVPGVTTILTNTRKYSELPIVLINEISNVTTKLRNASHIFMYCTGGVRCERASTFLQSVIETITVGNSTTIKSNGSSDSENENVENCIVPTTTTTTNTTRKKQLPEIYQLHGGIQRYLEQYSNDNNNNNNNIQSSSNYYYKGKNFVFDLRRTDPIVISTTTTTTTKTSIDDDNSNAIPKTRNNTTIVGQCLVCSTPYDDYDNGYAPLNNKETRCYKCRILILVCIDCRTNVLCWGDTNIDNNNDNRAIDITSKTRFTTKSNSTMDGIDKDKRKLYCGGLEPLECLYMPSVKEINGK
jgi:predicted sulfurtransferase